MSKEYINSDSKLLIENKHHDQFKVSFHNFQKGHRPENKPIKYTFEYIKTYVEQHNYILHSTEYTNATTPIIVSPKDQPSKKIRIRFNRFKNKMNQPEQTNPHKLKLNDINAELLQNNYLPLLKNEYKNTSSPVNLICHNGHNWKTTIQSFRQGSRCPQCNNKYSTGENIINSLLTFNQLNFEYQYTVKISGHNHYFDFYIPSLDIMIEYDGVQHYKPISFWGGEKSFIRQQNKDMLKNDYCKKHGINLIRIKYTQKSTKQIYEYLKAHGLPHLKFINNINYRIELATTSKQNIVKYYLSHTLKDTSNKFMLNRKTITTYFREIYAQSKTEFLKTHR